MFKVIATGSKGNAYLLEANKNEKLLIECGIPYKKLMEGLDYDIKGIKGCLISHEHKDHCKSINEIVLAGIDVYISEGTAREIDFKDPIEICKYRINIIKHNKAFKISNFTIVPFDVEHDTKEPLGFLIYHKDIGKVLFATDTYYLRNIFNGLNHILIECNYTEDILDSLPAYRSRVIKSHMSLETLKKTLKEWDLSSTKDITLIHLSEDNGDPERFKKEVEELTGIKTYIAIPGLILK